MRDRPFAILCLGDFSGRSTGDVVRVDRDDLDAALARARPEARLDTPVDVTIAVSSLEDLHPDRLFDRLPVFGVFRSVRRRLHDPEAFRAAAAEVRRWLTSERPAGRPTDEVRAAPPGPSEGQEVVRSLLAGGGRSREMSGGDEWAAFIRHLVAPHLVAREDPQRPELVAAVDRSSAAVMRGILHHPRFQALEARWRAVDFLTRRLETGSELQLRLLDISKSDLAAGLGGGDEARARRLRQVLVDEPTVPGAVQWSLLVGDYTFEVEDVVLMAALARLAGGAGAPLIAAASPRLLGPQSLEATPDPEDWGVTGEDRERWQALRTSTDARWLGLALPRFLLRLPYGRSGERLESFEFEELSPGAPHEEYLWGNPAFACACLLGQEFSEEGWSFRPAAAELGDLPLYVEEKDGERRTKPCAEVLLTLRAAEIMLERGFMPLLSFRDRDVVRLPRFQSVHEPLAPLAGAWTA